MRVGLIGENPNDTATIANLLRMKFDYHYIPVVKNRSEGDQLETEKFTKLLKAELRTKKFDVLIFIRDLDGFGNEEEKMSRRINWFDRNKKHFEGDTLFLLNIQSLEAIFFADVESLNKVYRINTKFKNPVFINKPKSELKRITLDKYHENRASELISKLNYETVLKNYKPLIHIDNYLKT
jgi:hypothetical protein